jgi:serine/threonine protein kinase
MEGLLRLGKYEILDEIGQGGFATVYLARDTVLGREVALKVLDPLLMRDDTFVERFKREARAAAALQHPNLVTVFDLGDSDGRLYIAQEYLSGGDLKRLLAERALPLSRVATVVDQVGSALDYAHQRGMIHRDVKPGNILFDERGWARLSDFGIARALSSTRYTTTGAKLGTPEYMAPEQAEGQDLDGRTDVYALGVVAYEMITGQVPFSGDTPSAIHYKHVHAPPPPPREVEPTVPERVSEVILKALIKERGGRYASCAEFSEALNAAITLSAQADWKLQLAQVEGLAARGEFALAAKQMEEMTRQRPDDLRLEQLRSRIQQELELITNYTEATQHLAAARVKAHRVLSLRPDYPDQDGHFETLGLRETRRLKQDGAIDQAASERPLLSPQESTRPVLKAVLWLLVASSLVAIAALVLAGWP